METYLFSSCARKSTPSARGGKLTIIPRDTPPDPVSAVVTGVGAVTAAVEPASGFREHPTATRRKSAGIVNNLNDMPARVANRVTGPQLVGRYSFFQHLTES